MPSLADIVGRFRRNPDAPLTESDLATLAADGQDDLWALKALFFSTYRKGSFAESSRYALRILELEPSDENAVNAVVLQRELGDREGGLLLLGKHRSIIEPIGYHDLANSLLAGLGRVSLAIAHGQKSLELKDRPAAKRELPVLHRYSLNDRSRNILSFSVWGGNPRYLQGAINNAIVARYLYPGWTCRFYTDDSTREDFRRALVSLGAQVILPDLPADPFGLFWRFLVEDDPDVDIYVVRDADAVVNVKERVAVAQWLSSGYAFHVMRDHLQHCELMLAGMWGAHRGNIGQMRQKIESYVASLPKRAGYRHKDQHFLRDIVWPIAKTSLITHDSYFNFMNPRRFDGNFMLPSDMHVGQNDFIRKKSQTR